MSLNIGVQLAQNKLLTRREPQSLIAIVDIVPARAGTGSGPLSLGLVLDRSASMSDERKIERLREAVGRAIDLLRPADEVMVVVFNHRAEVLVPGSGDRSVSALRAAVNGIRAEGGTRLSEGLREGLRLVTTGAAGVRQILVLTDGQTDSDEELCLEYARDAAGRQIPVHAFGLGTDWNSGLLNEIGRLTGGSVAALVDPATMGASFERLVAAGQSTVATNGWLQLRALGQTVMRSIAVWKRDTVEMEKLSSRGEASHPILLGDVSTSGGATGAGGVRVGIELLVPPTEPGEQKLLDVDLDYYQLDGQPGRLHADVVVEATYDAATIRPNPSQDVQNTSRMFLATGRIQRIYEEYEAMRASGPAEEIGRRQEDIRRMFPLLQSVGAQAAVVLHEANIEKMGRREQVIEGTVPTNSTVAVT